MKTILVALDFSDVTLKVVKAAVHLAKLGIGPGPDVVPIPSTHEAPFPPDYTENLARIQELISATGLASTTVDLQGQAIDLILAQAETSRVDLIVLGSHRRGPLSHLFLGSVADGILKRARCPVLIVPMSDNRT